MGRGTAVFNMCVHVRAHVYACAWKELSISYSYLKFNNMESACVQYSFNSQNVIPLDRVIKRGPIKIQLLLPLLTAILFWRMLLKRRTLAK